MSLFFVSSWCNSSYSSYRPGAIHPIFQIVLVQYTSAERNSNFRSGVFWSKKICTYEIECALLLFLFVGPGLLRGWRRRWLAVEDSAAIGWLQHLVFWSFIEIWKRIIIELPVSIHNWDAYITRPSLSLTLNIIFMIKNHSIVVGRPSLGSRISFRMDASSRASSASKATSPSLKYLIDGNPGDGEVEVSLVALPNQTVVHSSQSSTVSLHKLIILLTFFTKQMIQCHFKQYRFLLCMLYNKISINPQIKSLTSKLLSTLRCITKLLPINPQLKSLTIKKTQN